MADSHPEVRVDVLSKDTFFFFSLVLVDQQF